LFFEEIQNKNNSLYNGMDCQGISKGIFRKYIGFIEEEGSITDGYRNNEIRIS
jgi:hypothetical protein